MSKMLGILVMAFLLAACDDGEIDSEDDCEDAGGRVVAGSGSPGECAADEVQIGAWHFGIEGAVCCR
jgi:hypothetical protein